MSLESPAPIIERSETLGHIGISDDTASILGSAEHILDEAGQILQDHDDRTDWQPSRRVHTFAYASVVRVPLSSKKRSHARCQVEEA